MDGVSDEGVRTAALPLKSTGELISIVSQAQIVNGLVGLGLRLVICWKPLHTELELLNSFFLPLHFRQIWSLFVSATMD